MCRTLRGKCPDPIKKLKEGACDGILLAAAGLKRLGSEEGKNGASSAWEPEQFLPAGDRESLQWRRKRIQRLTGSAARSTADHPVCAFTAERSVLETLQAGCHAPVAVYANLFEEDGETKLRLRGINGPEHASQLTDAELKNKIRRVDLCGTLQEISVTTLADQAGKDYFGHEIYHHYTCIKE